MADARIAAIHFRALPRPEPRKLEVAAEHLFAFGPVVEVSVPDFVFVEVGRSRRALELSGDPNEEAVARRIARKMRSIGHAVSVAIARDPDTGRTFAQHLSTSLTGSRHPFVSIPAGTEPERSAELPIRALLWTDPLEDPKGVELERLRALAGSMRLLGVRDVKRLLPLSPAQVASRFGHAGVLLMDRALGRRQRPLRPFVPPDRWVEEIAFDAPVEDLEPVLFTLRRLLSQLASRLDARGLAAGSLDMHFVTEPSADSVQSVKRHNVTLEVKFAKPTRRASTMLSLCRERLQGALPGALWGIAVEATLPSADRGSQLELWSGHEKKIEAVGALVGRLCAALGERAVFSPTIRDTHRPEAAWTGLPFAINLALLEPPVLKPRQTAGGEKQPPDSIARTKVQSEARLPDVGADLVVTAIPERSRSTSHESFDSETFDDERRAWPKPVSCRVEDEPLPEIPPRPIQLFSSPEPARTHEQGQDQQKTLLWRGERLRIAGFGGLERLEAEWWTPSRVDREYFMIDIEDGRRLWAFYDSIGALFVHGIFD